jgi:hypothetical protein
MNRKATLITIALVATAIVVAGAVSVKSNVKLGGPRCWLSQTGYTSCGDESACEDCCRGCDGCDCDTCRCDCCDSSCCAASGCCSCGDECTCEKCCGEADGCTCDTCECNCCNSGCCAIKG